MWRSHIGIDGENDLSRSAWAFLQPLLADAEAYVFTRQLLRAGVCSAVAGVDHPALHRSLLAEEPADGSAGRATRHWSTWDSLPATRPGPVCRYTRRDGSPGEVNQPASVVAEALPEPDDPVVVQVSRWDRLKDMVGVMRGFAEHVAPNGPGWLVLAGPSVDGVTDDPEGAIVFAETLAQWQQPSATASGPA